ncbi:Uncharacterised protein [Bordetella pertussis]|nr:Uncharacterised protein [Bordetella pertussis]
MSQASRYRPWILLLRDTPPWLRPPGVSWYTRTTRLMKRLR